MLKDSLHGNKLQYNIKIVQKIKLHSTKRMGYWMDGWMDGVGELNR